MHGMGPGSNACRHVNVSLVQIVMLPWARHSVLVFEATTCVRVLGQIPVQLRLINFPRPDAKTFASTMKLLGRVA